MHKQICFISSVDFGAEASLEDCLSPYAPWAWFSEYATLACKVNRSCGYSTVLNIRLLCNWHQLYTQEEWNEGVHGEAYLSIEVITNFVPTEPGFVHLLSSLQDAYFWPSLCQMGLNSITVLFLSLYLVLCDFE